MDRIILDDIPFEVEEKGLAQILKIKPGSRSASEFSQILEEASLIAKPKAAFAVVSADVITDDSVEIGSVILKSHVLKVNLEHAGIVYPFVATCGTEIEEWSKNMSGMLHSFWGDNIKLMALGCAISRLEAYLKERLEGATLSSMNPGSLADWPLEQQAPLFELLGDAAGAIGVSLTRSMVIHPLKSVSGILFVSEEGFVNCSLCPREHCPGRRADYDASLYEVKFRHR